MNNALDHLVWLSSDRGAGMRYFAAATGNEMKVGGSHEKIGTHNALGSLGSGVYLEVLSPDPANGVSGRFRDSLARYSDGLFHWAVRSDGLAAIDRILRGNGLETSGVVSLSRDTADGRRLEWRMLMTSGHRYKALLPFFIDWGDLPHPSTTSPICGKLSQFFLSSFHAPSLRSLFDAIGLAVDVNDAEKSTITAVIDSPGGRLELPMAAPFPDGIFL
jgi:hypothetical protein